MEESSLRDSRFFIEFGGSLSAGDDKSRSTRPYDSR